MEAKAHFKHYYQESWEELYLLSDEWKTDLEFYHYELRFITNAINKNFLWLIKDENIADIHDNIKKLKNANDQHKKIVFKLNNHMIRLEELMMNSFLPDDEQFREDHKKLEDEFYAFERNLRAIKMESFSITEHTFEEKNLNYTLAF